MQILYFLKTNAILKFDPVSSLRHIIKSLFGPDELTVFPYPAQFLRGQWPLLDSRQINFQLLPVLWTCQNEVDMRI